MAAVADARHPQELLEAFAALKEECAICYQCGTCTSSCPSGRELYRGPRRIVRLILAGEIDAVLGSDDLWRCTGCGACTAVCRMDIDVAGVLQRLRELERRYGEIRCAERTAARVATGHLERRRRIDNLRFGAAMVSRGYVPKDKVGAVGQGMKLVRQMLPGGGRRQTDEATPADDAVTLPFYAGCSLPQDRELHAAVHQVAAGFGVRLDEATDAGCCGHPSRGSVASLFATDALVYTACPACDAGLAESGIESVPLWDALTARAARSPGMELRAAGDRFVPYVGCIAERHGFGRARRGGPAVERHDDGRLPDAAQWVLRRPRGDVPWRHQEQRAADGVRRAAPGARGDHVPAVPRQPAFGRARAEAPRAGPPLARVLPGRVHDRPVRPSDGRSPHCGRRPHHPRGAPR